MFCICTLSSDTPANATAPRFPHRWSKKHKIRIQQQQAPSSVNHMGNNSPRGCWEHGEGVRGGCPRAGGHQQQQALLSSRFLSRRGMSGFTANFMPSLFLCPAHFVLNRCFRLVFQCEKHQILSSIHSISAFAFSCIQGHCGVSKAWCTLEKFKRRLCVNAHTNTHQREVYGCQLT